MITMTRASVNNAPDTAQDIPIEIQLHLNINLTKDTQLAVSKSSYFKSECLEISRQLDRISPMLSSTYRLAISPQLPPLYDRPLCRIFAAVSRNLEKTNSLLEKCGRRSFLHRVFNLITAADFREVSGDLDASAADLRWVLGIYGGDVSVGLPPIASNEPILARVWSCIATVQMLGSLHDRVEAASELSSLAGDNDRMKLMIVEEGGVPPLLKLLKERESPEAQIAAANALFNLGWKIEDRLWVGVIVQVLSDSAMSVQIRVSSLISRMAEFVEDAKEVFAWADVIRPLVSLLSFETFDDDNIGVFDGKRVSSKYPDGESSRGGGQTRRKEREMESPEVKRELKVSCSRALWMLAKNSVPNSRRITETKGLLCLAKLIEKENGDLRVHCLMTIMEITSVAESNVDLRTSAFKTNSLAAKAVVEQLLSVIKFSGQKLYQIPAIRSIGSLSRIFPARETRVIGPLVEQLSCKDHEVGIEAAIALGKFVCYDNFLRKEHAKTIIEFNALIPLIRLLREGEMAQVHGLRLLCNLSFYTRDIEAPAQARVLTALEGADQTMAAQDPQLRYLIPNAIYVLHCYRGDKMSPYTPGPRWAWF